jgi:hypothetical protein
MCSALRLIRLPVGALRRRERSGVRDMLVLQIVATSHAAEPCVGSGNISGTLSSPKYALVTLIVCSHRGHAARARWALWLLRPL